MRPPLWRSSVPRRIANLGALGALIPALPATAHAAGLESTQGSVGEVFGLGHSVSELRDGRLLFPGGSDPFVDAGGTVTCCRPTGRSFDDGLG
jgi:hypothetical protein